MNLSSEFCVTDDPRPETENDEKLEGAEGAEGADSGSNLAFDNDEGLTENDAPSGGAVSRVNPERSLVLALAAARTAAENGGTDVVVMDMSAHTAIFDYFVIATGTSRRQLHAMSEEIDHKLEDDLKDKRMNIDGYHDSRWIVLDYATVVIHLFDEDTRINYALEVLWADAKKVDLTETLKNIRQ